MSRERRRGTTSSALALGIGALLGVVTLGCGDSAGDGTGTETHSTSTTTHGEAEGTTAGAMTTTAVDGSSSSGTTASTTSEDSTGPLPPAEGSFWVFVSVQGRVSTWSMDPATGVLTFERELPFDGPGGPLAVDPQRTTLYVAVSSANRVDAFAIDQVTAELSPMGQVDLGLNPVYLRTDQTGRHLLTATFGGDQLAIFPIGDDGSLGSAATQVLGTPEEPHSILTDPSNQWVLVPHRTPNVIGQYAFDASTGTVSPNAVPQVAAMPGSGPRHMVFAPDGGHAYVADEFSDSVSTYAFDSGTGQLTLEGTLSTLPMGFDGSMNTCADIHVTPDGRFVYVSNRGHDSLAMFAVDEGTGQLSALGQVTTEARPREFELSPRGRYAFAAGQDSNMMASYAVDPVTGMLSPEAVYDVGQEPLWVLAVELPPVE